MRVVPVILAGGSGHRLWPMSRPDEPKPFLARGRTSLFIDSLSRVADPELFGPPLVVVAENLVALARQQARGAGVTGLGILAEPSPRNTAAAIAAAAALVAQRDDENAVLHVMPSDHAVADIAGYCAAAGLAAALAETGTIALIGARPDRPATTYGYIVPGAPVAGGHAVSRFAEKPDAETAARLIAAGALWNTGTVTARAADILAAFEVHAPAVLAAVRTALAAATNEDRVVRPDPEAYSAAPAGAFDTAVLESAGGLVVVPAGFDWADLGTWPAIKAGQPADRAGNVSFGPARLLDTGDSLIVSTGPAVAAVGLDGMAVIADGDTVLVAPLSALDGPALSELSREAPSTAGHLFDLPGLGGRILTLQPQTELSITADPDLDRAIVAVDGTIAVETGDKTTRLDRGAAATIPPGSDCTLKNSGLVSLRVLQITLSPQSSGTATASGRSLPAPPGLDVGGVTE